MDVIPGGVPLIGLVGMLTEMLLGVRGDHEEGIVVWQTPGIFQKEAAELVLRSAWDAEPHFDIEVVR